MKPPVDEEHTSVLQDLEIMGVGAGPLQKVGRWCGCGQGPGAAATQLQPCVTQWRLGQELPGHTVFQEKL